MPPRKALLLRVGIDRGTGGALSPIFADGSFEYVPIPETKPTQCPLTFATLPSHCGRSLAAFVPRRIADRPAHIDPDFEHLTYGDAAPHKRRQLARLEPGDLLVFYAGFEPWPHQDIPRLFAIGWFEVKAVHRLPAQQISTDCELRLRFGNTAHFWRHPPDQELALIEGEPRQSRFLRQAVPLGDGEDRLLQDLIAFGYRGSLRRAVGHWLHGPAVAALVSWLHEGPGALIEDTTRLLAVPYAKVHTARDGRPGDLAIRDPQPSVGDWVSTREEGGFALARINKRTESGEALASLFWDIRRPASAIRDPIPLPDLQTLREPGPGAIRRLVSWAASRFRIGVHSA
jgi:putative DNA base modification enzyme with NMAD domain